MKNRKRYIGKSIQMALAAGIALFGLATCAIENDIPYPIIEAQIESIEVEGQRGAESEAFEAAEINKNDRTVQLYVNDSVDVTKLKITRLQITKQSQLIPDSAACVDYAKFPKEGFASLDSISVLSNTRMNFSKDVNFTLRTYQDYVWKVSVKQIIQRDINISGQVGNAVIDANSHNVIIYVAADQDLTNITVSEMNLGGKYGSVEPNPLNVRDFSSARTFYVSHAWEETSTKWTVYVYHDESGSAGSSSVFPMCTQASLSGSIQSGKTPEVEYKKQADARWTKLPASDVSVKGTNFSATLKGLTPGTDYQYRVNVDGANGTSQSFSTVRAVALENGSFEKWHQEGKQWIPCASGANAFWGTGNSGSAQFIGNLTSPTDASVKGKAALLESKNAIIKLGAGNIFTGDFALDGLNGVLKFGRPFTSFPTALRFYYKYTSSPINRIGDDVGSLSQLRDRPDTCHVYIALSDKSEPYEIRTNPATRQLFDKNDKNIIAYGEFLRGETTSGYQQVTIPLTYRATNRTPKMIVVVASASKYGDYFIGGEGSTLWLDEMELVYE